MLLYTIVKIECMPKMTGSIFFQPQKSGSHSLLNLWFVHLENIWVNQISGLGKPVFLLQVQAIKSHKQLPAADGRNGDLSL